MPMLPNPRNFIPADKAAAPDFATAAARDQALGLEAQKQKYGMIKDAVAGAGKLYSAYGEETGKYPGLDWIANKLGHGTDAPSETLAQRSANWASTPVKDVIPGMGAGQGSKDLWNASQQFVNPGAVDPSALTSALRGGEGASKLAGLAGGAMKAIPYAGAVTGVADVAEGIGQGNIGQTLEGALNVGAAVPGPQQPFVAAAAALNQIFKGAGLYG